MGKCSLFSCKICCPSVHLLLGKRPVWQTCAYSFVPVLIISTHVVTCVTSFNNDYDAGYFTNYKPWRMSGSASGMRFMQICCLTLALLCQRNCIIFFTCDIFGCPSWATHLPCETNKCQERFLFLVLHYCSRYEGEIEQ